MKQSRQSSLQASSHQNTALILVAAGFFLGGLFGCIFAGSVSGSGSLALDSYINNFISAVQEGTIHMPGVLSSAWTILRWPIIIMILSFSVIGVVGIPAVFFVRGFLFSFCVASFVQVLGRSGILFAFMLLGVESLLSIPVLFMFGTQGILVASQAKEKKSRPERLRALTCDPAVAFRNVICIFVLAFCTFWEVIFVPMLLSGAAHLFAA